MNKPLQVSLLLNAVLLGCLVFIWTTRLPVAAPAAPPLPSVVPLPVVSAPKPAVLPPPPPSPFRWSQLYSSDYHKYVKNLRAIGCPEPTVRAIVTADVDSVYQIIASRLEQKLAALAKTSFSDQLNSAGSEQSLHDSLQKLPAEEAAKIADLLGLKPAQPTAAVAEVSEPAGAVPMPLVMQNVDLSTLNLTADQTQEVSQIKQDFLKQIGGANQDPSDPAYQVRWKIAQSDADDMLEAILGNDVYTRYELAAHQLMLEQIEASRH